ncbi:MAG: deoxyribonuclease V [Nitrospinae bacterium]|nr:deoxyribonuclease V [Nitrospinota bacterium]
MQYKNLHKWDISPAEAVEIQKNLREKIITENEHGEVRYIAGADISFNRKSLLGYAVVAVMTFPDLEVVEEKRIEAEIKFPYIPGLLAFREAPILLKAFEKLKIEPDLIIFDGQGIAHPRGMGIASHLGIILNKPTIGCAKSKLFGTYKEPGKNEGNFSYLYSPQETDNVIGAVVRTKSNTKPVFVSIGHKIDLQTSIKFILECRRGYRIPEPTRIAHNLVSKQI